jgi:hypothetical protein
MATLPSLEVGASGSAPSHEIEETDFNIENLEINPKNITNSNELPKIEENPTNNELINNVIKDLVELIQKAPVDDVMKYRTMVHLETFKNKMIKLYNKPKKQRGFKLKEI